MENGVIGETRARAFLSERFWILDRSVDVDGADMLIQRRLTRLHDKDTPRLGLIQVKFLQDERTIAYVDAGYVCDQTGPLREFFLLAYTGLGDHARTFLLSAQDIVSDFSVAPESHTRAGKYVLGGRALLSPKYRLNSVTNGLNRIERALLLAGLERNRHYLFYMSPFFEQPMREQIEPEFLVPLDNGWGNIPEEFFDSKKRAQTALYRVDEFAESLRKIIVSSDPETALSIAEDLDSDTRDGTLWFGERIYDQELHTTIIQHRERHDQLCEVGLLETFLNLNDQIAAFIANDLSPRLPVQEGNGYVFEMSYDSTTLSRFQFTGTIAPVPEEIKDRGSWFDEARLLLAMPGGMCQWRMRPPEVKNLGAKFEGGACVLCRLARERSRRGMVLRVRAHRAGQDLRG